jgi:hypothetical protein
MFSMQFITNFTIKTLFWEVEIFLNAFSECRKCYFRDPNFRDPPCYLVPAVLGSHLRRSHTNPGGRARKMGPLAVLTHHWRILKKCTENQKGERKWGCPRTVHGYWLYWCDRHWLLAVSSIYIWSENSSTESETVLTAQPKNNRKGLELTTQCDQIW